MELSIKKPLTDLDMRLIYPLDQKSYIWCYLTFLSPRIGEICLCRADV